MTLPGGARPRAVRDPRLRDRPRPVRHAAARGPAGGGTQRFGRPSAVPAAPRPPGRVCRSRHPHRREHDAQRRGHPPGWRVAHAAALTESGVVPGNPYRGLECFEQEHAALYFGRERVARALLALTDEHPLVALIGVAGSGKSSLVRAGLPEAHVVLPGEPLPMPGAGRMLLVVDQFERTAARRPGDRPAVGARGEPRAGRDRGARRGLRGGAGAPRAGRGDRADDAPAADRTRSAAARSRSRRGAAGARSRRRRGADRAPTSAPISGRWAPRCTRCGSATLRPARCRATKVSRLSLRRRPPRTGAAARAGAAPRKASPAGRRRWAPVLAAALVLVVIVALFTSKRTDDSVASRAIAAAALPALDRRFDAGCC